MNDLLPPLPILLIRRDDVGKEEKAPFNRLPPADAKTKLCVVVNDNIAAITSNTTRKEEGNDEATPVIAFAPKQGRRRCCAQRQQARSEATDDSEAFLLLFACNKAQSFIVFTTQAAGKDL